MRGVRVVYDMYRCYLLACLQGVNEARHSRHARGGRRRQGAGARLLQGGMYICNFVYRSSTTSYIYGVEGTDIVGRYVGIYTHYSYIIAESCLVPSQSIIFSERRCGGDQLFSVTLGQDFRPLVSFDVHSRRLRYIHVKLKYTRDTHPPAGPSFFFALLYFRFVFSCVYC